MKVVAGKEEKRPQRRRIPDVAGLKLTTESLYRPPSSFFRRLEIPPTGSAAHILDTSWPARHPLFPVKPRKRLISPVRTHRLDRSRPSGEGRYSPARRKRKALWPEPCRPLSVRRFFVRRNGFLEDDSAVIRDVGERLFGAAGPPVKARIRGDRRVNSGRMGREGCAARYLRRRKPGASSGGCTR